MQNMPTAVVVASTEQSIRGKKNFPPKIFSQKFTKKKLL